MMGWLSLAIGGRKGKNEALEQELQVLTEGAREERNRFEVRRGQREV